MGISSKEYGSLLIPVYIMSKLPEIGIQIARKSTNEVWKIEELLESIKTELEAREASEEIKAKDFSRKPPQNNGPPLRFYPIRTTILTSRAVFSVKNAISLLRATRSSTLK